MKTIFQAVTLMALVTFIFLASSAGAYAGPIMPLIMPTLAGWMGIAAGTTAFALLEFAVGMALSAIVYAVAAKPAITGGGIQTDQTLTSEDEPQSTIIGTYATAGALAAPFYTFEYPGDDDSEYLMAICAIADTPIESIERMWVDGAEYTLLPQRVLGQAGYTDDDFYGQRLHSTAEDNLNGLAFCRFLNGTQTEADPVLMQTLGNHPERPWNANMIGTGIAYAILTFKYRQKKNSGIPNWKFEVKGMKLYDPRKDSSVGGSGTQRWATPSTWAYSANPIVQIYNIERGIKVGNVTWGMNAKFEELPLSNWIAAMNYCDQTLVNNPADDRIRYQTGFEIKLDQQPSDVIKELLSGCGGKIAYSNDGYYINIAPAAPVATIRDENIIIDQPRDSVIKESLNNTYNAVSATYPDKNTQYESKEAIPLFNAAWEAEDSNRQLIAELKLACVTNPGQVNRLMDEMAKDNRRVRTHNIVLPPSYLHLEILDTVNWISTNHGYDDGKLFEITGKQIDQSLNVYLSLRERDPADYASNPERDGKRPFYPSVNPVIPNPVGVAGFAVAGITINDTNGRSKKAAIRANWTTTEADGLAIQIRMAASGVVVSDVNIQDLDAGYTIISDGIIGNTEYQARAKKIFKNRNSVWGPWLNVTTPAAYVYGDDFEDGVRGLFDSAGITAVRQIADRNVIGGYDGELAWSLADSALYVWNASQAKWEGLVDSQLSEILEDTMVAIGLATIKVVSALPATGTAGQQVVFQGKLYRWTGTKWQTAIEALGTNGQLTSDQIESIAAAKIAGQIDGSKIANTAINAQHLAAGSVTALKIAADAVEAANIKTGAVLEAKLANNAVSLAKLANNAVDASKLVNNAVTEVKIAINAVTNTKIAAGAVLEAKLANNAVTLAKLANNAVDVSKIIDGAVTELKIADNAVSNLKIATNAITETKISSGAISTPKIQVGAITTDLLAANSVTAIKITAGAVTANAIAANSITALHIVANTITAAEIAANTITGAKIAANTITANQIAANTITSNEIKSLTITGNEIAATTITGAKLVANTITALQIAANTITSAEIAANTITGAKIAANTITANEIAANTITANEIASATITGVKIAANTIVSNNIVVGAISARELAANSIIASKIAVTASSLVLDSEWRDLDGYWTLNNSVATFGTAGNQPTQYYGQDRILTIRNIVGTNAGWVNLYQSDKMSVQEGVDYFASTGLWTNAAGSFIIRIGFYNSAGNYISALVLHSGALTAGSRMLTNSAKAPAGAVYARAEMFIYRSLGKPDINVGRIVFKEKNTGEMIVDGAIQGIHVGANTISGNSIVAGSILGSRIAANTITGNHIIANTINANTAIIDGTITSALIKTGAIGADQIAAGSIVASKLAITDFNNLVPDDQMIDVNAWIVAAPANNVTHNPNTNSSSVISSKGIFSITPGGAETVSIYSNRSSCMPGEEYYFSAEIWSQGSADVRFVMQFFNKDGAGVGSKTVGAGASTGFRKVEGSALAPAGAAQVRVYYHVPANSYGGGNIVVGSPVLRMKGKGSLIVDGSITANNIVVGTLHGGLLAASGIITKSGQIDDAVITNANIRNAEISYLKIAGNTLYIPRLYTRADVTLNDATSQTNYVTLFNQNIPDFDGGGYMIAFNGIVDSNINYDSFGRFQLIVDGIVRQTASAGIRVSGANGGGFIPVVLIASYKGTGTTNIQIRGWSHSSGDLGGANGNADCIVRNMSLTVSGTRR